MVRIDIRCPFYYHQSSMARTTVNIDRPILQDLKRLQKQEKKPLGQLMSELLREALARRRAKSVPAPSFDWKHKPMKARIDITDKDALYAALDRDE